MAEAGIMTLSLKIAGDDFDDFYPYELILEEGFSRVYRAELTVFTDVKRDQKDLKELLELSASVTISQRLAGDVARRHRYLHGIITRVANFGIVSRGESKPCYRHIITIESELARLRHTNLSCPYYGMTPPDVIEEILSRYGIKGEFSDDYINRSTYTKGGMFEQTNIPDLDFIYKVMNLYGLSWTFVHGKASQSGLGTAELHFSEGSRFPAPLYEYSDGREIPDIEQFNFLDFDEKRNIWKMDAWRMESGIGVDGLEITAAYPEEGYGSEEWQWGKVEPGKRYHSHCSLFHVYERGTEPEEIDEDIKRMIEAQRLTFYSEKVSLKGSTENITVMPGIIFELSSFMGQKDTQVISALVTDMQLRVRAMWPRDLVSPPAGEEAGELAFVEFSAKDWGPDSEKRFCQIQRQENKK